MTSFRAAARVCSKIPSSLRKSSSDEPTWGFFFFIPFQRNWNSFRVPLMIHASDAGVRQEPRRGCPNHSYLAYEWVTRALMRFWGASPER
jgi:hypothetical protein